MYPYDSRMYSYVSRMYPYVLLCFSHVTCMLPYVQYSYVSRVLLLCYPYVLVCYSCILVCTRMSLVCHLCGVLVTICVYCLNLMNCGSLKLIAVVPNFHRCMYCNCSPFSIGNRMVSSVNLGVICMSAFFKNVKL